MSGCNNCTGNCGSCDGCGKVLELSEGELHMLQKLGQIPFLPVARTAADPTPVYLEDGDLSREESSLILQCLEKKGLITIDFDTPLKGLADPVYAPYPICGSFALSRRGQQVLELLDIQGLQNKEGNGII